MAAKAAHETAEAARLSLEAAQRAEHAARETAEAAEVLRQASQLAPNLPDAHYNLGNVLRDLGDLDGAREARQWSDRLGLSPLAMLRLRWEVVADEVGGRRQERAKPVTRRLKAVDNAAPSA